jgi:hypothetical protein
MPSSPAPDRRRRTGVVLAGPALSRRRFLGGVGVAAVLAACGGDDTGSADADDSGPGSSDAAATGSTSDVVDSAELAVGTYTLVQRFPQNVQVPGELRLPFSLSTGAAEFVDDGPETLGAQVFTLDGEPIGGRITAQRRMITPAAYYPFRPTVDTPGFYAIVVDGGPAEGANFDVADPEGVVVPGRGDALAPFDTPTTADDRGVDPICTREPVCPFHDQTLTDALADGRPVAYYVGTPAFCTTGTCAPALESLIGVAEEYADRFHFVHAEVYTDLTATETTPAVDDLQLFYEPVLFVTDAGGTIVERLDALFDVTELREALDRVA